MRKMYRNICWVLVVLLSFSLLTGCGEKDDLPEGACYVVTVTRSFPNGGDTVMITLVYDGSGKLLREQKGAARTDYIYDDQGRLCSIRGHNLELDVPLRMVDYTYNEAGQLIQEKGYYMVEDYGDYCYTYEYDERGNLTCKKTVDASGKLVDKTTYASDGQILKYIRYNIEQYHVYTYTEDGKLLRHWQGDFDNPQNIMDYFYNDQGLLMRTVETFWQYGEKKRCTREYTYDQYDRLVRKYVYDSDGLKKAYDYVYDETGNMVSFLYTRADAQTDYQTISTGHRWEYDETGRITTCYSVGKSEDFSYVHRWAYDEEGNVTRWEKYSSISTFSYSWPEGEIPQAVKESVAAYVADIVEMARHTPEYHTSEHYNPMIWRRLP